MARKHTGLGRGLSALIPDGEENEQNQYQENVSGSRKESVRKNNSQTEDKTEDSPLKTVRLSMLEPDKTQPRRNFPEEELDELAASIKEHGLLQPIIVVQNKNNQHYTIVAGERRWRACRKAGLKEVQVIVREFKDQQEQLEASLIENLQREDLNPLEEAAAYQRLIDEFGLTQEEVAGKVAKSRTAVTNSLRLLKLSPAVQQMVTDGTLTMGQARPLLSVEDPAQQKALAEQIAEKDLSAREVEKLVRSLGKTHKRSSAAKDPSMAAAYADLENRMQESLGMNVKIAYKEQGGGKVEITFAGNDDLDKLMERIFSTKN